jgi:AraC-like DNA-binding protein
MFFDSIRLEQPFSFSSFTGNWTHHELHIHDCLEIGVISRNRVKYRIGSKEYVGKEGDVFLLRPFEPHWALSYEGESYDCQMLLFNSSAVRNVPDGDQLIVPFYSWVDMMSPRIDASTEAALAIRDCIADALTAADKKLAGWRAKQYASFIQILITVCDIYNLHVPENSDHRRASDMASALKGVQVFLAQYQDPITSEHALEASGLKRSAFHTLFRQLTGLTPHVFLSRIRVHAAMDLLVNSNLSILEISEESGFPSLSTFNKQFKSFLNCSPSTYRLQSPHRHLSSY